MKISIFKNIKTVTGADNRDILSVLENIREGRWQDAILRIRSAKEKKEKNFLKSQLPYFTVCGTFSRRAISGISEHSGLIALDFDDLENPPSFRDLISADKYCLSAFLSAGGKGVAAIFRVGKIADNAENHAAYIALSEYAHEKYGYIETDASCKDISRARYVSYDPDLKINENAEIFKGRKKVKAAEAKEIKAFSIVPITIQDLDYICAQIEEKDIDIVPTYSEWLATAFALVSEFGEDARHHFHRISAISPKYSHSKCDAQFDSCLKNHSDAKETKISYGSFLKICSDNGIKKQTETTKEIVSKSISQKRAGKDAQSVIDYLQKENQISSERSEKLVKQVFENDKIADPNDELPPLERLAKWITGKGIKFNEASLFLEMDGEKLLDRDFNGVYFDFLTEEFGGEKKMSFQDFRLFLTSSKIRSENPVTKYFESLSAISTKGYIAQLAQSLRCKTGILTREDFVEHFLKKWLTGIVAISYGEPTDTFLTLTGKTGIGKTEFFKNLFPRELSQYATMLRLDGSKDDFINFATNAFVYFDDVEAADLKMTGRLKSIITSSEYTIRRPYSSSPEKMKRRCGFGATTNEKNIVSDIFGERRMVVFELNEHFYSEMMAVDRTLLWAEVCELYREWKEKKAWLLSREEISQLQKSLWEFSVVDTLDELLVRHLEPSESYMSASQILEGIVSRTERTLLRESVVSVGRTMQNLSVRYPYMAKVGQRGYRVKFKDDFYSNIQNPFQ